MLIDTARLSQHLDDPGWIVFDCRHDLMDTARGERVYRAGHIPGSFFAPVDTALSGVKNGANGRHPLPDPGAFAAFLARQGVTEATRIVAYDDVGGQYAARLWWMAGWIGLAGAMVLDGGWSKWLAEGRPATAELPAPRAGGHVTPRGDSSRLRTTADVLAGLSDRERVVVDARAPERFRGEVEPLDPVAGHIPAARNRFFKDNLNADLTMRPAAELRREFEALLGGIGPERVTHQCGSGITACANLLAMEHAGLGGSKLYAGSWSEWVADPARPVARG